MDDGGGARRAGGVVVQLLLQGPQQAAEVRGGVVGARAPVLDGAEGLREEPQLPEALLEQALGRLGGFVWGEEERKWKARTEEFMTFSLYVMTVSITIKCSAFSIHT